MQNATWSAQKRTHLLKLHIQCSTRGRIISESGLWNASVNDAKIFENELKKGLIKI